MNNFIYSCTILSNIDHNISKSPISLIAIKRREIDYGVKHNGDTRLAPGKKERKKDAKRRTSDPVDNSINYYTHFMVNIGFPAHFRHLFIQFKKKRCFNFDPDTLECANARFDVVFGQSILKHCHTISCFVTRFRQLQFKFVCHSAEHETAKSIIFQSFTQNRLQDYNGP